LKKIFLSATTFLCFFSQNSFAQDIPSPDKYTAKNKGKFYVFWGGNRESFSKSDIHFRGEDYNFTLNNVSAQDKPKGWHVDYINPN
jgi:hypothetical protein